MSVWEGIVVTPSDKAYEKLETQEGDGEEEDDEDMEGGAAKVANNNVAKNAHWEKLTWWSIVVHFDLQF